MNGFKLPGVVWSALLVALPLLSVWLGDSFPGAQWVAPVAGLLLIAAKVIEFVMAQNRAAPPLPEGVMAAPAPEPQRSIWWG